MVGEELAQRRSEAVRAALLGGGALAALAGLVFRDDVDAPHALAVDLVRQLARLAQRERAAEHRLVRRLASEWSTRPSVSLAGLPSGRRKRIASFLLPLGLGWMTSTGRVPCCRVSRGGATMRGVLGDGGGSENGMRVTPG